MLNINSIKKLNPRQFLKNHPRFLKISFFSIIILILIFGYKHFTKPKPRMHGMTKVVEVEKVKLGNIQETIRLIGTIKPQHSTILFAKTTGRLDLIAHAGEKLKKGELIAKIDDAERAKSYQLSEVSEKIAKSQYERVAGLLKSGHVSAKEVEEKKAAWVEVQKAASSTRMELDKNRFYAPFEGVVGVFKAREGAYVNEGDVIGSFYDPDSLMVEFDIPASVVHSVKDGQPVNVTGKDYNLTHVQHMIDESTHMAPAYVDIVCPECVIGTAVEVDLTVQQKLNVISVPFDAVFPQKDEMAVYIVAEGKAELRPVKPGIRAKDRIEIISGLKIGDQIIARNPDRIYPNAPVEIYTPKTENKNKKSVKNSSK